MNESIRKETQILVSYFCAKCSNFIQTCFSLQVFISMYGICYKTNLCIVCRYVANILMLTKKYPYLVDTQQALQALEALQARTDKLKYFLRSL